MGGRGATSSNVINNIKNSFRDYIKKNGLPQSFRVPNMQDKKQVRTAFEAINENYKASKEEQNVMKEIRLIKDSDGTERLYYQGANETVTDFSQSAINGVKKWMANSYVKRKR